MTEDMECRQEAGLSSGVPQESIRGPKIWNVVYSGVVDLELLVGYESSPVLDMRNGGDGGASSF